jgi:hypothetical protein
MILPHRQTVVKTDGGFQPMFQNSLARYRCHGLERFAQFAFELGLAFVQGLQPQLPTMELNTELINIPSHLGALRFILFQLALQICHFVRRCRAYRRRHGWNERRFPATLTI